MDFTALILALAAVCTRPSDQLHDRMPAGRLMSLPVLAPLVLLGCCFGAQQGMVVGFVSTQSWYQSGQNPVSFVKLIVQLSVCVCVCVLLERLSTVCKDGTLNSTSQLQHAQCMFCSVHDESDDGLLSKECTLPLWCLPSNWVVDGLLDSHSSPGDIHDSILQKQMNLPQLWHADTGSGHFEFHRPLPAAASSVCLLQ